MLLMRWFGCACGGLEVKRAGADAAHALVWVCLWGPDAADAADARWFGCACGGLNVKQAGADAVDAADALVWVCLWGPGGETGRC